MIGTVVLVVAERNTKLPVRFIPTNGIISVVANHYILLMERDGWLVTNRVAINVGDTNIVVTVPNKKPQS